MRYDDKNKSNHDNQRAWDYIMYMMLVSYFKKANCLTTFWEQKLSLNYSAMKKQDQYAAEEKCVKTIEEDILPKLPEEFLNSKVDVRLTIDEKEDVTVIEITDGIDKLLVSYKYDVKKVELKDKQEDNKSIKRYSKSPLRMKFEKVEE